MTCACCGARLPETDHAWSRCTHCDSIAWSTDPMPLPGPERFQVRRRGPTLVVEWVPVRPAAAFLLAFGISWLAFCALFALTSLCLLPLTALILLPFVGVGAALTWVGAAGLVNRTTLEVGPRRLRVHSGPVPVGGSSAGSTRPRTPCGSSSGSKSTSSWGTSTSRARLRCGRDSAFRRLPSFRDGACRGRSPAIPSVLFRAKAPRSAETGEAGQLGHHRPTP